MATRFVSFSSLLGDEGPGSTEVVPFQEMVQARIRPFYPAVQPMEPRLLDQPERVAESRPSRLSTDDAIAQLVTEAEQRGKAEAEATLREQSRELAEVRERIAALTEVLDSDRDIRAKEAGELVGQFLAATVRRVLGTVPEVLDTLLRQRIPAIAEQMIASDSVVLTVRPDDVELALELVGPRAGWTVVSDPSVRGGCRARGSVGSIDGTVGTALEAVDEAIAAWRAEAEELDGIHEEAA